MVQVGSISDHDYATIVLVVEFKGLVGRLDTLLRGEWDQDGG